jgi:two-component system nitrate/nitrite response regulator NarL
VSARVAPTPGKKILIVGSDALARAGIAGLLNLNGIVEIVGQVGPDEDVVASARSLGAGAVIWDFGPGGTPGRAEIAAITESGIPVLALVGSSGGPATDLLRRGVRGVLFRDADADQVSAALGVLDKGLVVLDAELPELIAAPQTGPTPESVESLTPREMEVLGLLSQGLANKAIAERLGISEHTAKFHVNSIISKLGAEGRTEAVVRAARLGLVVL